jgi:uncharacterized protein (DUF427 family)
MANDQAVESVWDYPRPPRWERVENHLRVIHGGVVLADTTQAIRVLETSHPPVYYIPPADVAMQFLKPSPRRSSYCEFKGFATYWNIHLLDIDQKPCSSPDAAWSYGNPSPAFTVLRDYLAFYASKVDTCTVDAERVSPQPGDFYGGWITSRVKGPFKGAPGTLGW